MSKERWDVMMVKEFEGRDGPKSFWTKIGTAFTNKNGSINVQLDAVPVDGKIQLQIPLSKEEIEKKRAARQQSQGQSPSGMQNRRRQSTPQKAVPRDYEPNEDDSGEEGPF